ncbi:7618_t:CDS:2, partial [Dentiscutata heterogama]
KNKDDSQDGSTNSEDTIETNGYTDKSSRGSNNPVISNVNNRKYVAIHGPATGSNGSNINRPRDNEPLTKQNPETSRIYTMQTTSTDFNTEQGEETELDDVKSVKYKITNRKFPALSYVSLKPLSDVQGMTNKEAIATEQIRRCSFFNLQDFAYKNIVNNVKYEDENTVLQISESGTISIKKRTRNTAFRDISEWLMAFKAYMEAVLILYENREQELNTIEITLMNCA